MNLKIDRSGSFLDLLVDIDTLDRSVKGELRSLAKEARADLIQTLSEPKTGREYGAGKRRFYKLVAGWALKKTAQGQAWRASAPGEAPAVRLGVLVRSIRIKVPRKTGGFAQSVFADRRTAFYRMALETGSPTMQPRRFMEPLIAHYEPLVGPRIETAVDKAVAVINGGAR